SIIAAKLTDEPRMDLKVTFDGAARDAKNVRVARAQATALVFALLRREGPKGAKKLADLIEDAFRRDRVPDLDKALGLPPGPAFKLRTWVVGWPLRPPENLGPAGIEPATRRL